ncbi:CotH kinase family protein [Fervidobacterium pennivorans subsp. shakshaketiis]|jgi:hypothetical protein|uniref:CotH protein n=1 Tax=Fervidobacterium pennivorans (strain DSM 9078 / Ven5) TaxID=771875 RepID=H9UEC7_FERPD|nr:CotH kinase family protein [Fervidobacterium pennivorans]AFG35870.1 CotH protein [Fervidobacterium pennivorans DSM 9078]QIV78946.1 spore coat protein CotH [Fervidobacterium pennivorans subsp. keratinolyticus]
MRSQVIVAIVFAVLVSTIAFSQLIISHESGFYESPFQVEIKSTVGGQIYYTMDGTDPVIGNTRTVEYERAIPIVERYDNTLIYIPTSPLYWKKPEGEFKKATVLKIIEVVNGKVTDSAVRTYFVGIHHDLPVVSIITDPSNLFDEEKGIYVPGKLFDSANPEWSGNYHQRGSDWERKAIMEYFENGKLVYRTDIGLRIHGEYTRNFPIKSLRLYARNREGEFTYPFFGRIGYKKLILRNSGNDWEATYIRDSAVQEIFKGLNFDTQDNYPVVHYINGEYWGIIYLMEYYDQRYLQVKHGVSEKNTVIINGDLSIQDGKEGGQESFVKLAEFVKDNDLSRPENYSYVASMIDIDSYIEYKIAEIIAGNMDWPGNNERMWRVLKPEDKHFGDGKWRWMMYDMDLSFWEPTHNTLKVAMYGDPNVWVTVTVGATSTLLFRRLLENEDFKKKFLERFDYVLNVVFNEDRVVKIIDEHASRIKTEIALHSRRWGKPEIDNWESEIEWMKEFARERKRYIREYLNAIFGTGK